ncbi:hypothetical protein SAMN04488544_2021 [Microlunatus sagamiharensis]|uniref:Uncharacterized protein n=1 Tax=Microlunatus sagamiharensis TaxID=546874 RepID=A0A1H2MH85_9ACTN|nr:hypothetical protein [Microlunatus sagamiharensis]SDU92261.1 hypothetical protein SAMN04488544_2021 [Microlunatus sagamiharensis]
MSVPRPWPARRPVWQLVMGLVGLLVAVLWLVALLVSPSADAWRILMVVVWAGIGLVSILSWRRTVKEYDADGGRDETPRPDGG